jgi:threonine dehydrogenase-like Zn-dependent dehydrogenase
MTTPLPQTTLRLVKEKPQSSYELKEVSLPALQGDELLVKVAKVALCGTDISLYQWNTGETQGTLCFLAYGVHKLVLCYMQD